VSDYGAFLDSKAPQPFSRPPGRPQSLYSTYADIDRTIAMWDRSGVDYCDVWWALGKRTPCDGGWPAVRQVMIRWAERNAPARLAA
jgi:hypothetical protein